MSNFKFGTLCFVLILLACGQGNKPSEGGTFSAEAEKIESKTNLSSACEKDLKKYSQFLDEAKEYIEKYSKGEEPSAKDQKKWDQKSKDLAKEMASSALSLTDPKCAVAFAEIQAEFNKVMIQMVQAQM